MAINSLSTGFRPGVCTSSTRPTAPYEGQTIFETDTDRMYVWNGAAWVIPNAPAQNPTGLELITVGALSSTTTNFVGCFTATYDNYRIVLSSVQMSANADIYYRFLNGSTPETSSNYSFAIPGFRVDGVAENTSNAAAAVGYTGITQQGVPNTPVGNASMDIYSPKLSQRTFATVSALGYTSNWISRVGMTHFNLTTSFDGIQFTPLTGPTMGGTVSIYGYRK